MTKPRNRHHPDPKALQRKKKAGAKEAKQWWNCINCGKIKVKSVREGEAHHVACSAKKMKREAEAQRKAEAAKAAAAELSSATTKSARRKEVGK
uniref:Uncharacterized protein n=1 Tax=Oryza punctata TaxID=4537 RepID=A0A0E0M0R6_ORYPU